MPDKFYPRVLKELAKAVSEEFVVTSENSGKTGQVLEEWEGKSIMSIKR